MHKGTTLDPDTAGDLGRFMALMGDKLAENDHKLGWDSVTLTYHLRRMYQEVVELHGTLTNLKVNLNKSGHHPLNATDAKSVARQCADIANFAMFIADLTGGLAH
jgi:hypothetical protein